MATYLWLYGLTFSASFILSPLVIMFAKKIQLFDLPDERKIHDAAIPRGGGLAFSLVWLAAVAGLYLFGWVEPLSAASRFILGLLIGSSLMALLGLADDWRPIDSRAKLLLQSAAALIFLLVAKPHFLLSPAAVAAALIWIVLVTNAFNLVDGLDGLATGLAAISAASFAIIGFAGDQSTLFLASLALLGGCLAFLPYNWHPAEVFMGDVGSYFLGFVLAGLGLISLESARGIGDIALPVLFVAVPIFDTCLSIARRMVHKQPLFAPDKSHFYNLLMNRGFSHKGTVAFCYALATLFSAAGISFAFAAGITASILISGILATILVAMTVKLRLLAAE